MVVLCLGGLVVSEKVSLVWLHDLSVHKEWKGTELNVMTHDQRVARNLCFMAVRRVKGDLLIVFVECFVAIVKSTLRIWPCGVMCSCLYKCFVKMELHSTHLFVLNVDCVNKEIPQCFHGWVFSVVTLAPQTAWRARAGWRYKTTAARSTSTAPRWSLSAAPHWEPPGAAPVNPARSVSPHTRMLPVFDAPTILRKTRHVFSPPELRWKMCWLNLWHGI